MTPKNKKEKQLEQTKVSTDLELPKIKIIKKEITFDKNYSKNIQKLEDELVKDGYIDPLRALNLGRILSTNLHVNEKSKKKKETNFNRDLIISVLNNIEPKITRWIKSNNIKNENILVLKVNEKETSDLGFDKLLIEELKIYQELIKNKGYDKFIKIIKSQKFDIFNAIKQKIVDPENKVLLKEIKEQVINEINWNIKHKENKSNDLRLVIDLENFYVQGFINKDNTYFYYDENKNIDIIIPKIREIGIKNCFPLNLKVTYDDNLNIKISKAYLNKAIDNLKNIKLQEKFEFNMENKKDLIALVFATSEAMRFKMNIEDFTDNESDSNEINDLKSIENILSCVHEVINDDQKTIEWSNYKEQLNNWSKISKKCFNFRNQIYNQLLVMKKINIFFYKEKDEILKILMLNFNEIILKISKIDDKHEELEIENELKKEIQEKFEKNKSFNNLQKNEQELVLQTIIWLGIQKVKAKFDNFNQEIEDKDVTTRLEDSIYFLNDWNFSTIDLVVLQKNKDLFNLLIKLELNENDKDEKRCFKALHFAIINNDLDMVQKLLKIQNIDVNYIFNGLTPLDLAIFQNEYGYTPLHVATKEGNLEIVKELLKHPKIEIEKRDNLFFSTPLGKATTSGNLEIVKLLLEKDNSSINYLDKWYRSPLHSASRNGYLEIVKLLLNNDADVNIQDEDFRESDYYKGVDKHVNNKSEEKIKNKIIFYYGNTPLHFAISYNQQIIVKELLNHPNSKNKIDVNIQNEYGYTPLHVATKEGNLEIVKELLNHPEIDLNIQDNDGNTPLHLFFEDEQNLQDLENENISQDIKNQIINKVNNFKLYKKDIFKLLIEYGADVNIQDNKEKSSILHWAFFKEDLEIVKELLKHPKINVNIQDNDGNTPLHFAVSKNNLEIVKELLKYKNIDVQKTNKKGEKPINLFCCRCKNEDIKNILELKSKIQITEKLLEDKSKLIQKQILDLNNKLIFYKKELENKLISSTTFSEQEKKTNEPLKSLKEEISSLKIEEINEEQTKKMRAITKRSKINSIDLQNQPSTSGYKPKAPQM